MASKATVRPTTNQWTLQRAKQMKSKYNHKYDIGDLVTKYPGKIWEVHDLNHDEKKGNLYCLVREIGGEVKRWKTAWVAEKDIAGAFVS